LGVRKSELIDDQIRGARFAEASDEFFIVEGAAETSGG
jgi:hypothetical protein